MKWLALLFALTVYVEAEKKSFHNYKVFSVKPKLQEHLTFLEHLSKNKNVMFWTDHYGIGSDVKIMVAPLFENQFKEILKQNSLQAIQKISNVQSLIDAQSKPATTRRNVRTAGSFDWINYHDLTSIYAWLDELEELYPDVVETVVIGQTNEGRDIKGIVIDFNKNETDSSKLHGFLEGGIHAREWISPATVTWIANEFLTSDDPDVKEMAENIAWHIFPVVNPDGYEYTFTTNRMWRKNRNYLSSISCGTDVDDDLSNGVDLNRNFDLRWMTIGASAFPCDETFAGVSGFSEPEARAIADYITLLQSNGIVMYYLAFHSYSQFLLVPPSDFTDADVLVVPNYGDLFEIGLRAMDKLEKRYGTRYLTGPSVEIMYAMSGGSFDWAKGAANVSIAYLVELRDTGAYGFLLPAEQIIPNNEEVMDSIVEMHKVAMKLGYYSVTRAFGSRLSVSALALVIALTNVFKLVV